MKNKIESFVFGTLGAFVMIALIHITPVAKALTDVVVWTDKAFQLVGTSSFFNAGSTVLDGAVGVGAPQGLDADVLTATTATPLFAVTGSSTTQTQIAGIANVADAAGVQIAGLKTRAAAGSTNGNTIVASGDDILRLSAYGADGVDYEPAAEILLESGGTPGSGDMPGRIIMSTTADGAEALSTALTIAADQSVTITGTLDTTATSFGFVSAAGANTACTTTCGAGKGCVLGYDIGTTALVACTSALADSCICSSS